MAEPEWTGTRVLTHSGSNSMWYARAVLIPDWDAAPLVTTNCAVQACKDGVGAAMKALATTWRARLEAKPEPEASPPAATPPAATPPDAANAEDAPGD